LATAAETVDPEPIRQKEEQVAQENVIVIGFSESSKAYQALSVLKEADAEGRIGLESAAVAERTANGKLRIRRAPTTSASSGRRAAR
jgi:uncharacterized membrane protein